MRQWAKTIVRGLAACALVCLPATLSLAITTPILTLNLSGGLGTQVGMDGGGDLFTFDDGIVGTTGNRNTDLTYEGNLGGLFANINAPTASFTLSNLTASGTPAVFSGSLMMQSFVGGSFELYGADNSLLLSGSLNNSTLVGLIGPGTPPNDPSSGTVFTSNFNAVTGGTLQNYIIGNVALQMHLSGLATPNESAGFRVYSDVLAPFAASSKVTILGAAVPEPAAAMLMLLGSFAAIARGRGQRR